MLFNCNKIFFPSNCCFAKRAEALSGKDYSKITISKKNQLLALIA